MRLFNSLLTVLALLAALPAFAQTEPIEVPADARDADRIEALQSLLDATATKAREVERLRAELERARDPSTREAAGNRLSKANEEYRYLRDRFRESAAMTDISVFEDKVKEPFSWQSALGKILEPILAEIEAASAESRQLGMLRQEVARFSEREAVAANALRRVEATLAAGVGSEALQGALDSEANLWRERLSIARNQANAARIQLEDLEAARGGFLDSATPYIRAFLTKRGLNLVVGILAALAVFFTMRLILHLLRKLRISANPNSLGSRLFDLVTNLLSVFGAIAALLIAFSAAGDLFLLGIVLIFLIGAAWAGIQIIPQFIESLKIILNVGMVKEDERLLFDDVPWNVDTLGFTCVLSNPRLDGAKLELPVRRLVGLHSRQWAHNEPRFPTAVNEWIELADGAFGQIVSQNPSTIEIAAPGGLIHTISTPQFLAQRPRNLSIRGFRIRNQLRFANTATQQLLDWVDNGLAAELQEAIQAMVPPEALLKLRAFLTQTDLTGTELTVESDFAPAAAPHYQTLRNAIPQSMLSAAHRRHIALPSIGQQASSLAS